MNNERIAEKFDLLADLLEIQGANPFRVRAYRNASRTISSTAESLEEMISSGMSLTFDRFRQDQVLQLLHQEEGSFASTGLSINDRPDGSKYSIPDMKRDFAEIEKLPADQQQARYAAHQAEGKLGNPRAFLGTTRDQGSALMLSDAAGRPRLLMMVGADGEPTLQVLDEQGKVKGVFALTPASSSK